jgi:cysteine desulfurase/selenocysteine lyase
VNGTRVDWAAVRADFPVLAREIDGRRIVYLDSGNTSQKPRQVLDAMDDFLRTGYAPINRSAYRLAAEATDRYEAARAAVARFVNARRPEEVVFTKNATEALNLVASSWGGSQLGAGDAVVLTHMEHHANIVPWHMLAERLGIELRWVPLTPDGQLDLTDLDRLLDGAKAFAFTAMSNVLGTLTPVAKLCAAAHDAGALAIVDACQFVPHNPTDVQAWDADFVAFSSHKMCGPSGIGALWGRAELLDAIPPYIGGGNMIADVRLDGFTPAPVPAKFEAGTLPMPSSTSTASAWARSGATRWSSPGTPSTRCATAMATTSRSTARTTSRCAAACSASPSAASTPTTSARCSTSRTSASAPGTTAPSR